MLPRRRAAEITQAGIEGSCPTSRAAIDMFSRCLGLSPAISRSRSVRRVEYLLVAEFCVICPNILPAPRFARVLRKKAASSKYLEPIPAYLILDENVAFVGLRALAEVEGIG